MNALGRSLAAIRRHIRAPLWLLAGALGAAAAVAVATVPDGGGTIHGCYLLDPTVGTVPDPHDGNLRVIDPSKGQSCRTDPAFTDREATLDFAQRGPAGPRGTVPRCKTIGHTVLGDGDIEFDITSVSVPKSSGKSAHVKLGKLSDSASPKLAKAATSGKDFETAEVRVFKPGTTTVKYRYKLKHATVSQFKAGAGDCEANKPSERLTLTAKSLQLQQH